MAEYFRQPRNRIQAGFAFHAGKLLVQYRNLTANLAPTDKFEATLAVCALQAILANCTELMSEMKRDQRGFWDDPINDIPGHWGIRRSFVTKNNFPGELTYADFVTHLRNALCHPSSADKEPWLPATGYTTIADESGVIARFCFTDSPWVVRGSIHSMASTSDQEKVTRTLRSLIKNRPPPAEIEVRYTGTKPVGWARFTSPTMLIMSLNLNTAFRVRVTVVLR